MMSSLVPNIPKEISNAKAKKKEITKGKQNFSGGFSGGIFSNPLLWV